MNGTFFERLGLAGSIVLLVLGFIVICGGFVTGMMAGLSLAAILAAVVFGAAGIVIGTTGIVKNARAN